MQTIENTIKKIILIIPIVFLTSCRAVNISTACPDIPFYTKEEQLELERIRKEANSLLLDKVLIDYGNLREDLRECNRTK